MAKTLTRPMFGWDLVYSSHENSISKKEDVLILLIHWSLTHKGFKCTGRPTHEVVTSNTEKTEEGSSSNTSHLRTESAPRPTGSEVLPQGWNSAPDGSYVIHYTLEDVPFILRSTRLEDVAVINLLRCTDSTISSIALQPDNIVKRLTGSIENMIPEYKNILSMVENKLLMPVHCISREAQTQTTHPEKREVGSLYEYHVDPQRGQRRDNQPTGSYPDFNPRNVGHTDLDPLGRTLPGAGMIFDPFRRDRGVPLGAGSFPRGSVPPGARFDPIGPLNPQPETPHRLRPRGFQPDPDHLPPPGFDDFIM